MFILWFQGITGTVSSTNFMTQPVYFVVPGNHWNREIVHMLVRGSTDYHSEGGSWGLLELAPVKLGSDPPGPEPRVFFTHLHLHHLPTQVQW